MLIFNETRDYLSIAIPSLSCAPELRLGTKIYLNYCHKNQPPFLEIGLIDIEVAANQEAMSVGLGLLTRGTAEVTLTFLSKYAAKYQYDRLTQAYNDYHKEKENNMPKPIPAWLEKAQDLLKNHSLTEDNPSCIYDQVLTQLRAAEVRVKQLSELIGELPDPTLSEILAEKIRQSLRATWSNRVTQLCDVEAARATYKKRPSTRNMMTLLETQANLWFNKLVLAKMPLSKLNLEALMRVKDQSDRWLQDLVCLATGRIPHTSFASSIDKEEVEE